MALGFCSASPSTYVPVRVVEQQIEFRFEQIFPSLLQMHEQLLLMFQHSIQAPLELVFFRYGKILPQQYVHRALIEPLPVHPKLAPGIDQPIDHQQFQHLCPGHALPSLGQLLSPETDPCQNFFRLPRG
jgi:hypothetical protein